MESAELLRTIMWGTGNKPNFCLEGVCPVITNTTYRTDYSSSWLRTRYYQTYEINILMHNAISQKTHPFPKTVNCIDLFTHMIQISWTFSAKLYTQISLIIIACTLCSFRKLKHLTLLTQSAKTEASLHRITGLKTHQSEPPVHRWKTVAE